MNLTELARRMRVSPEELRQKLPELGFSIGRKAIKVDNRVAMRIQEAWSEMQRKERLTRKMESQKEMAAKREENRASAESRPIEVPPVITVRDLASRLNVPVPRLMQELMRNGILASLNERIDFDTASILAEDLGFKAVPEAKGAAVPEEEMQAHNRVREAFALESKESLKPRPPVIVVMGHVDHGKTRLLDAIRQTHVMESEAGGITQHIGAYQVNRAGRDLTFIDTPGHEAFTVMRSRGAKVADIAILVVAADDGVRPQTKEAIDIIRSAGLPFIVALNKVDRAEADIDRVKGELSALEVVPEDWGGKTVMVPISAKENLHIDQLLDMLILVADMEAERIVANPARTAIGTVIESHVSSGTGPVATVLVQAGTLRAGDYLGVRGSAYGRVRAMEDWKGDRTDAASPSVPVRVIGWKVAPAVGDILEVPEDPKSLERVKSTDTSKRSTEDVATIQHVRAEAEEGEEEAAGKKTLNLIIRADVLGSLEAVLGMLDTVTHEDVGVKVVSRGLGNLTDTDVMNAKASGAILIGFNVNPTVTAEQLARDEAVSIRNYSVIYKLFEDVLDELEKLLPSETILTEIGMFEVLANFRKTDNGYIVGGKVLDGKVQPKARLRVKRGEEYIGEGEILVLQSGQREVKEMRAGQEAGLRIKAKTKPEIGDRFEVYTEERKARKLVIAGISKR